MTVTAHWFHVSSLFLCHTPPHSEEKQEADQDESAPAPWIIRAHQQHACSSHPQVHAPTRAHHAVCAEGHRARNHLLWL